MKFHNEVSYDDLRSTYPKSLIKGVNSYVYENKDLLDEDIFNFFTKAIKQFPYKDFIDSLVYTVVNKMRINIFDSDKYNIPTLIDQQYRQLYKNISNKIDAENDQKEEEKKAEQKKEILKDINSGNISDLRHLKILTDENQLFDSISKNNLVYKAYKFDMGMEDSKIEKLNQKTEVLLLVRSKGSVYMLFVGKTNADLKHIIVNSNIKTKPYDSIEDARKYYSGPIGEIPGYFTSDGIEDTSRIKSASVSYDELLRYAHAHRRDNYQNKYNNQNYWENDMNIFEKLNRINDNKSLRENLFSKQDDIREAVLDYIDSNYECYDIDYNIHDDILIVTGYCYGEYDEDIELKFTMDINKINNLINDEEALGNYIESCLTRTDNEERGNDFYRRAEKELEKHFGCTGAFLEPSTQGGEGDTFLFADDMSFDGNFDFQTGEEYIREDDFDGFLQLCLDSFTPSLEESLTESEDLTNSEKLRRALDKMKKSKTTDAASDSSDVEEEESTKELTNYEKAMRAVDSWYNKSDAEKEEAEREYLRKRDEAHKEAREFVHNFTSKYRYSPREAKDIIDYELERMF